MDNAFLNYFSSSLTSGDAWCVLASALLHRQRLSGWQDEISDRCSQAKVVSIFDESQPVPATSIPDDWQWLVSTNGIPGYEPGTVYIPNKSSTPFRMIQNFPLG